MERPEGEEDVDPSCIDDLTKLEQITLNSVLDCLINRFNMGHYYTFAGSVLISLNPCLKNAEGVGMLWSGEENSPHVYSIGRRCKDNLRRLGSDQIVVVSGDSGAGKTTVTQQLLCYFIENNDVGLIDNPIAQDGLERKIYCATQILEAFGNASTTANPNSSRFGRLVQIIYGKQNDLMDESILGAQIETCLLEKHRVSKCGPNERNFHIFYYILVESQHKLFNPESILKHLAKEEDGRELGSLIPEDFRHSLRPTDADGFNIFYDSIRTLNMVSEIYSVFEIIYGLMILLSLKFVAINPEEKENDPNVNHYRNSFNSRYFRVDCESKCKQVIEAIFKINFDALEDSLVARNFSAGRRKSSIRKPCETINECKERLAAFVTTIYDRIFSHILQRLNSLLVYSANLMNASTFNTRNPEERETKSVSLLDLYGFENLKANHLEQLCINYANERLQQVHISHLRNYMEENVGYDEKGLESLDIFSQIEMHTISRLDGLHRHVFSTLDETCVLNRPQTDAQVFSRMVEVFKGNSFIRNGRLHDENYPFVVKHYASSVTYNLRGMVDKNRDYVSQINCRSLWTSKNKSVKIPPEFVGLFRLSQNQVMASMFKIKTSSDVGDGCSHKIKREKTVLQHFKASVESLVCRLETSHSNSQDVHFIRCIRPNDTLEYGKIQRKLVEQQLFSCGIVDVIRITGNGYPVRLPMQKFLWKFHPLMSRCFNSCFTQGDETRLNLETSDLKFGKSQIFLSESAWEFLNVLNAFVAERSAKILQKFWRSEIEKRRLAREELLVLQESYNSDLLQGFQISADSTTQYSLGSSHDTVQNLSLTKIETSLLNSLPCKITMRRKKKLVQNNAIYSHVARSALPEFPSMVYTNKRKDIVSKRFVYESPIWFYVKKTSLSHNHLLPRRFLPQGVMDAFDDSSMLQENVTS